MTNRMGQNDVQARQAAGQPFRGRYLTITSYKRGGIAVATPVWFVSQHGKLLVKIDAASGKVKRVRTCRSAPARTAAPRVGRFDQLDPQHHRREPIWVTGQPAPRHPALAT
jgi:hypothetical protein